MIIEMRSQTHACARVILQQLGGGRFVAMTGARGFIGDATSLKFRIPKAKQGINCVRVVLEPNDLYRVEFYRLGKLPTSAECEPLESRDFISCDQLQDCFTQVTGLRTRL